MKELDSVREESLNVLKDRQHLPYRELREAVSQKLHMELYKVSEYLMQLQEKGILISAMGNTGLWHDDELVRLGEEARKLQRPKIKRMLEDTNWWQLLGFVLITIGIVVTYLSSKS